LNTLLKRAMEAKVGNDEPSLPFAYLGPNHPTLYFPDSGRPAILFHRSLLRPHAVILSKTIKDAGASLDLNEEPANATTVDGNLGAKSPACELDQTRPDEPAVNIEGRVDVKKKNFVESSCQTEWQLPPKENFVPVPLARRDTVMQLENSSRVEGDQGCPSVQESAQEDMESLRKDFQDHVEAPSDVNALDDDDNAKATASGPASPLLKASETDGADSGERLVVEEEVADSTLVEEKLVSPSCSAEESNAAVSDSKEESILPDLDNADVVMGILQEDIVQSNNIEEVLKQPTNNDVLADLIAELNNGLCDENKNSKEVENVGDCSPSMPLLAGGSCGGAGGDQLLQQSTGMPQHLIVESSLANQTVGNVKEGLGSSTTSNSTPTPQPLIARPNGIRVPFPFPSRGVATDRIAISPMACLPLTAFKPMLRGNLARPQVSFPLAEANYTVQHLLPVNSPLPLMNHKLTPGTNTGALLAQPTLPSMTLKHVSLPGGFNSWNVGNFKGPHVGSLDRNLRGSGDTNLNTITISSDEEDSQIPGSLQEVLVEVFRVVSSNKAASHFRWSGNGLAPPYFRQTSAPIDLSMMEVKVKEAIYSAATQFRADLQAVVTACKDGLDVEHPTRKAALYLMALAEQRLSMYGLGRGRSGVGKSNGGGRGRGRGRGSREGLSTSRIVSHSLK